MTNRDEISCEHIITEIYLNSRIYNLFFKIQERGIMVIPIYLFIYLFIFVQNIFYSFFFGIFISLFKCMYKIIGFKTFFKFFANILLSGI